MAVKSIVPLRNTVANTEYGPTPVLWGGEGCPGGNWVEDFLQDPRLGYHFFDTFVDGAPSASLTTSATTGSYGSWGLYAYANAIVTDASVPGGVIQLQCGTTSHQGIALTKYAGAVQLASSNSNPIPGFMAFEARVALNFAVTTAASAYDAFVGLSDAGAPGSGKPITTTNNSLYNSCNLIGFQRIGSVGNDWSFVYQASGIAAVYPTNLQTLINSVTGSNYTANQYVKLGFIYNPTPISATLGSTTTGNSTVGPARPMIQIFVNGQPAAAFLTAANVSSSNFPQGVMGPALAIMNSSTATNCSMYVDWVRVAQSNWQ